MLYDRGVYIEAKPFSIGFRIEHPQDLIDRARFGDYAGHKILGAADYKLVHHCKMDVLFIASACVQGASCGGNFRSRTGGN